MSKVTIIIEDKEDEVMVHGSVEPFMTEDKLVFTTAEIIGLYMQDNIAKIMADAVKWSQTPDPVEEVDVKEPSLIILPGAQL
jgi:hypothetical protein